MRTQHSAPEHDLPAATETLRGRSRTGLIAETRARMAAVVRRSGADFREARVPSCRATGLEIGGHIPGDELLGTARYRTTRAITIDAASDQVWPWLVQMGQGRGGLYSYDWLENLLGLDIHSAQHIDPALQELAVGDQIRLVPEDTQPPLQFTVARIEAPHVLVLGPEGTREAAVAAGLPYPCWTFQLVDQATGGCRLVVRFQCDFEPTPRGLLVYKYALAPVHLVMERKMLRGIKQRAEGAA